MSLNPVTGQRESSAMPARVRDVLGRLKVSFHQNVYEADFEYGPQPLRWEQVTSGAGQVQAISSSGGVRMRVGNAAGDLALRQSRPYHRYQPGKTMFMATGCQLGVATPGQIQRVGFFDDANGVFFEQSTPTSTNPYGMYAVIRSDVGGTVQETRFPLDQWNGDIANIRQLDFTRIQMFWIEYAWYGAGATRFGFWVNGEPIIAHQIGWGNYVNAGVPQLTPWARTGNLPVRYELRNINQVVPNPSDMIHYGVSVIVEGQRDEQRGFTYSYGFPNNAQTRTVTQNQTRVPVLTIRGRPMGTNEFGNIYGRYDAGANTTASSVLSATSTASWISGTTLNVGGTASGFAVGLALTGLGIPLGTYIAALGTGSGGVGTYTISTSLTVGSSTNTQPINAYANTITLTGTPLVANAWIGKNIYFPGLGTTVTATPNATGTLGTSTVTVSSATNILVGAIVTGTGVQTQSATYSVFTSVVAISGTTVTLSSALTATISASSLTFTSTLGAGAMGRVVYNSTSQIYFVDPVTGTNLPSAPTITTSNVTQSFASGGGAGSTTVVVGANTGITAGQYILGTGLQPGTKVEYVSGTTIGFSIPAGGQISGTLTFGTGYVIGLANRGQLLPRRLMVSSDTRCLVEVIASTPTNPTVLTAPVFTPTNVLGSVYSFAERDINASALSGGEVVFAFTLAAGSGLQDIDFSYFFPLYNNIRGSGVDTLSLCISGNGGASSVVAANLICQEAMS
jgi:hypothetical protein